MWMKIIIAPISARNCCPCKIWVQVWNASTNKSHLLCFMQLCTFQTQNSRSWAVLQWLCAQTADAQLRCSDWLFWGGCVLFPSLEDDFAFQSSVKGDGIQPESLLYIFPAALLFLAAFEPLWCSSFCLLLKQAAPFLCSWVLASLAAHQHTSQHQIHLDEFALKLKSGTFSGIS